MNLKQKNVEGLGLQNVLKVQFELLSSLIINKSYFSCKNYTHMFANTIDLPINIVIKYSKNQAVGFHLIDVYNNQPIDFKNITFIQYLTNFEYDKL